MKLVIGGNNTLTWLILVRARGAGEDTNAWRGHEGQERTQRVSPSGLPPRQIANDLLVSFVVYT